MRRISNRNRRRRIWGRAPIPRIHNRHSIIVHLTHDRIPLSTVEERIPMASRIAGLFLLVGVVSISQAGPESMFSEKGHDFGPIPRGTRLTHRFYFTNNTKEPV